MDVSGGAPEADFVLIEEVIPPHSAPDQEAEKDNSVELPAVTTDREGNGVNRGGLEGEGDDLETDFLNLGGELDQGRQLSRVAVKAQAPIPAVSRSTWTTAGSHFNPFHLPRSNTVTVTTDIVF